MGYYTNTKEIVGWGAPPNTTCDYCKKRRASVLVTEVPYGAEVKVTSLVVGTTQPTPGGPVRWSCNDCTPAHSCTDHISNKLGEVMSAILANSPA